MRYPRCLIPSGEHNNSQPNFCRSFAPTSLAVAAQPIVAVVSRQAEAPVRGRPDVLHLRAGVCCGSVTLSFSSQVASRRQTRLTRVPIVMLHGALCVALVACDVLCYVL